MTSPGTCPAGGDGREPALPGIDGPHSPEATLRVAGLVAEGTRYLNHATRHHEALRYPSDADRVVRELASMAGRLDQLLEQIGAWLAAEQEAGRIGMAASEFGGGPVAAVRAVTTARLRLDAARLEAENLHGALEYAGHVLAELGGVEDGTDG
jgi:hypothetical protein